METKKIKNPSPRIRIIQKIYNSLMNPDTHIQYSKNQYKKFIKDVVSGTLERSELIEETIKKHLSGSKILELGCSTGLSTKLLSNLDVEITVVEGSKINIQKSKENFKFKNKVTFIESLWDEFKSKEKFSDILLVDSLQLISNRNEFLSYYKKFLMDTGVFHIIVPNSNSLHRQIGKYMGLIKTLNDQSDKDKLVSSNQDLTWESARRLFQNLDFEVVAEEPILLKPLDNKNMLKLEIDQIDAFFKIAKDFKSISSHMHFVLKNV